MKPTSDQQKMNSSPNHSATSPSPPSNLNGESNNNNNNNKLLSNERTSPGISLSTKEIGVGANLNVNLSSAGAGRHSSAPVSVGHGLYGSIHGPSSVSISTGVNRNQTSLPGTYSSNNNHNNTSLTSASSMGASSLKVSQRCRDRTSSISPGLIASSSPSKNIFLISNFVL